MSRELTTDQSMQRVNQGPESVRRFVRRTQINLVPPFATYCAAHGKNSYEWTTKT